MKAVEVRFKTKVALDRIVSAKTEVDVHIGLLVYFSAGNPGPSYVVRQISPEFPVMRRQ